MGNSSRAFFRSVSVGYFIAVRQVKRTNKWMTALTVAIMMLTFFNLIVTSGFLVGIIVGSENAFKEQWVGDVNIGPAEGETEILKTVEFENIIQSVPETVSYSSRLLRGGLVEANWLEKSKESDANRVSTTIAGVVPSHEEKTSHLSRHLVEGEWLSDDDPKGIIIGSSLLEDYSPVADVVSLLRDIHPGTTVKLTVGQEEKEFIVRGIIKSKVDVVSNRVFISKNELQKMSGKYDSNVQEISVRVSEGVDPYIVKSPLVQNGYSKYGRINAGPEGSPEFLVNLKKFFNTLGLILGSISLVVSVITIFIVIYINAITRRRQIGILKGIGVTPLALESAYIFQALFYTLFGVVIALIVIFAVLKPYITAHPIVSPFADIILVAEPVSVAQKVLLVTVVAILSGYIPSRLIVKQNTLNSILGRN